MDTFLAENTPIYHRTITAAPETVVSNGQFNFGCYNTPFLQANLLQARRPYWLPLPRAVRNRRLREWQAFQILGSDYFVMVALYNAKLTALAQCIIYDIKDNFKLRYEAEVSPRKIILPDTLFGGIGAYRSPKFNIETESDAATGKLLINITAKKFQKMPDLHATFVARHQWQQYEPMAVCMPFAPRRAMYAYKNLMPVQGQVYFGKEIIYMSSSNSALIIDDHKGFYPRPTIYRWATGLGYDKQANLVGFNLTQNQVQQPEQYNENGFWYNGKLNPLPPVQFFRPDVQEGEWLIKDNYGQVDLRFTPVCHTHFNKNLLLVKSRYYAPYGYFNGYVKREDGKPYAIENMFGMCEDFYLKL